jgi:signal transduction histidine kinase
LLDFTAARRSGIALVRKQHDLHTVVEAALEDLRSNWPGRIVAHKKTGTALSFLDQDRITQVVRNLIGNALQHSPVESQVLVETRGDTAGVVFTVHNHGRPIPAELLPRLFAPMRRGEGAGHRQGSLGLGLFIVHHLVLAHGGTIDVRSSELDGTHFTIRLPSTPGAWVS